MLDLGCFLEIGKATCSKEWLVDLRFHELTLFFSISLGLASNGKSNSLTLDLKPSISTLATKAAIPAQLRLPTDSINPLQLKTKIYMN